MLRAALDLRGEGGLAAIRSGGRREDLGRRAHKERRRKGTHFDSSALH
jgi:predicted methyltransferase MtxX (methanogen marker protein 4)